MTETPVHNRWWGTVWYGKGLQDACFLYGLSRQRPSTRLPDGIFPKLPYVPDNYDHDGISEEGDYADWRLKMKELAPARPLIAFAVAIDHWQEPAMRVLERDKWKLVAIGNRTHDRTVLRDGKNLPAYVRFYMKKYIKTGVVDNSAPPVSYATFSAGSCALGAVDYERVYATSPAPTIWPRPEDPEHMSCMRLFRIPTAKLETWTLPKENFACIAKTKFAKYFLTNYVELYVKEIK